MTLRIEQLDVVYGDHAHGIQALEQVTLEIPGGTCLALVGESGSGKTTLGKACMGLLPASARQGGRISLEGDMVDPTDEATLNRIRWQRIAMVFQDGAASLNPSHRIIDQVAEPLIQLANVNKKAARVQSADALTYVGLPRRSHTHYPHQLSGGQLQRAQIAMATILDPDFLILDEPTSALDALTKGMVSHVIQERLARGKGVLLITHDLEFAAQNAVSVNVLYLGQIMEMLPAGDLFAEPFHPYTLALKRSYPAMDTGRDLGGIRGDAFYRTIHQHAHRDDQAYRHSHIQVPESVHEDGHAPPTGCLFYPRCTQAIRDCRTGHVPLLRVGNHDVRCVRQGIADRMSLEGVKKSYGEMTALDNTELRLKAGEVFSLVGETGSGKTTLAMIVAGVLRPDQGRRYFEERDMDQWIKTDYRSLARQIGVIYQNPAESISHRFSVLDAVAEPLRIHRVGKDRQDRLARVKACLAKVHLSTDAAFLKRYPHELNLGALQRICMARALVLDPRFLVADEPTSALDPSVQAKVLKLLLDLQIETGMTLLFVTHDMGLARKISDRMGVMLQGRVVETGPASQLLNHPRHPYTRLLMESVSGKQGPEAYEEDDFKHPVGCPFVFRCQHGRAICREQIPLSRLEGHTRVACHFPF